MLDLGMKRVLKGFIDVRWDQVGPTVLDLHRNCSEDDIFLLEPSFNFTKRDYDNVVMLLIFHEFKPLNQTVPTPMREKEVLASSSSSPTTNLMNY